MRLFLTRLFYFFIPIVLLIAPPVYILKISGENYTDLDLIIESRQPYQIGYAYNEQNYTYLKWREINSRPKQSILAFGTSRILQFRQEMFNEPFYNAGYSVRKLTDYVSFIKSISVDKYPKVLLINLDQWMFNPNWDTVDFNNREEAYWTKKYKSTPSFQTLTNTWIDILKNKYTLNSIKDRKNNADVKLVGLNSIINDKGFRADGSMNYGDQIKKLLVNDSTANDYGYTDTIDRINSGTRRFEYGSDLNPRALEELDKFLIYCQLYNINVVGILPPFADKVNEHLIQSENHEYLNYIYLSVKNIFDIYNFEFWDMSHLSLYNSSDRETIDGFHGSEVTYLKMLIYMLKNDSILNNFTRMDDLLVSYENRINNYVVYE